ncbi:type II secretion system F family protein [Bradyrhizobium sp. WYCCWR 13022]|uniref:type II secretion system F family protein n=1 Tax=unclassified Bradyrhizobium TaxID=2631580 RepID=UPI00263B6276|nr:type II secretion system F family protein [Bradyrhizobium sp. WYCCWR 13022]MDN4986790.1 type II secretion system F family protein [Bradyrhizobium sp. WYCCWR 13022]
MSTPLIIVLVLLLCATVNTLWLDARQRRMERRVEIALPTSEAETWVSIRRATKASRWDLLYRLVNYQVDIVYAVHPSLVFLVGAVAAGMVLYGNHRLLQLSTPVVSIAAGAVALLVVRGVFGWQRSRFINLLFRQLPDAIQLVTSTVRSGLPVNEAFRTIAREMPQPTAREFATVCSELNLGKPPEEAVEGIYRRTLIPEYAMFAVTLAVQLKAGGSLAETLQTLAETVSQRVALAARAKALAGEVIFSSRALSLSPVIIGGLLYAINPQSIDLLFYDPTGNMLLAYAAGSVIVGHFVIRWMIRRETAL